MTGTLLRERVALCVTPVTLNGNRARISGATRRFATVTDLTTRLSAEWSWDAVRRVVGSGGRFES